MCCVRMGSPGAAKNARLCSQPRTEETPDPEGSELLNKPREGPPAGGTESEETLGEDYAS